VCSHVGAAKPFHHHLLCLDQPMGKQPRIDPEYEGRLRLYLMAVTGVEQASHQN
jgi:hypothetical protein